MNALKISYRRTSRTNGLHFSFLLGFICLYVLRNSTMTVWVDVTTLIFWNPYHTWSHIICIKLYLNCKGLFTREAARVLGTEMERQGVHMGSDSWRFLSGVSMCTFAFAFAFAFAYPFAFAFAFAFSLSPCLRFSCVLLCVIQNGSDHMIYKNKSREK